MSIKCFSSRFQLSRVFFSRCSCVLFWFPGAASTAFYGANRCYLLDVVIHCAGKCLEHFSSSGRAPGRFYYHLSQGRKGQSFLRHLSFAKQLKSVAKSVAVAQFLRRERETAVKRCADVAHAALLCFFSFFSRSGFTTRAFTAGLTQSNLSIYS